MIGRLGQTLGRAFHFIIISAALAACVAAAPRQYRTAISADAPLHCRALQAVIDERERYGIVAASTDLDENELRECGRPHSSGGGPPFEATRVIPAPGGSHEVKIERRGDTYSVPVRINDTITLPFLLDTGASDLVIPADVALTLIRAGALTSGDFIGKSQYRLADGSIAVSDLVMVREVQVGEHEVRNVTASISPAKGEPLLGQSFLSKFGAVTVDYKRLVLILSR